MLADKPISFRDLPTDAFPFVIEYLRADNDVRVHRTEVTGPGVVEVPPLGQQLGVELYVLVRFPDGFVQDSRD